MSIISIELKFILLSGSKKYQCVGKHYLGKALPTNSKTPATSVNNLMSVTAEVLFNKENALISFAAYYF